MPQVKEGDDVTALMNAPSIKEGDDVTSLVNGPVKDDSIWGKVKSTVSDITSSPTFKRFAFGPTAEDQAASRKDLLDNAGSDKQKFLDLEKKTGNPVGQITGMPADDSILPKVTHEPDTFMGGYANSLYNDYIRPLASPQGFMSSMMPKAIPRVNGAALEEAVQQTKNARQLAGLDKPTPRLALPPVNPTTTAEGLPVSNMRPSEPSFVAGPSGASGDVLATKPSINKAALPADSVPNVNPTDAAKIAGLNTGGIPSTSAIGEGFDTNAVKEASRQNKLSYTAAEQYPGSRLSLSDRPPMESPPSPGDTTLGFSQKGKLDTYPYNVVPDRLRPRAVQGDRANVVPDRFKITPTPEESSDLGFTSGGKEVTGDVPPTEKPDYYTGNPSAPTELPSAVKGKPTVPESTPNAQIKPTVKAPDGSTIPLKGKAKQIVDNANTVDNQDVKDVVQKAVQDPSFQERFNKSLGKEAYDAVGTTTETQLGKLSDKLGMSARRAQLDGDSLAGTLKNAYHKIVDDLSDKEWDNVRNGLEGKLEKGTVLTAKESNAIPEIRKLLDSVGMQGQEVGLNMKNAEGRTVPLALRQDYFPHTYDPEVLAQLKQDPSKVIDILTKQGKSPVEIDQIMKNTRQFKERMLNSQNAREADLPGYRTDKDVLDKYFTDISHRIEQARNFGARDIGDLNSPAMQMVRESKDPEKALELMKLVTGRMAPYNKTAVKFSNAVTSAEAAVHLSTSALSHINAPQFVLLNSNLENFSKAGLKTLTDFQAAGDIAKDSGAWENLRTALTGAPDTFKVTDLFGLHKAQQIPRAWAAVAGQEDAKQAFLALKQNPGNAKVAARLKNLLLEEPSELLKQDALTTKQINRAGGRMAQLSQGLSSTLDKPPAWNGPMMKIATQFHNFAMSQTKSTWAALKANPVRNIPLLAGTMLASGEVSGDAKAALKGLAKGLIDGKPIQNMEDEIKNRGNWITLMKGHPALQHLTENMFQSWALGIPLDMAKAAASGGNALFGVIAGPAAQDGIRAMDDLKGLVTGKTAFNKVRPTFKDMLSKIPIVGSGFSSAVPPPDKVLRP